MATGDLVNITFESGTATGTNGFATTSAGTLVLDSTGAQEGTYSLDVTTGGNHGETTYAATADVYGMAYMLKDGETDSTRAWLALRTAGGERFSLRLSSTGKLRVYAEGVFESDDGLMPTLANGTNHRIEWHVNFTSGLTEVWVTTEHGARGSAIYSDTHVYTATADRLRAGAINSGVYDFRLDYIQLSTTDNLTPYDVGTTELFNLTFDSGLTGDGGFDSLAGANSASMELSGSALEGTAARIPGVASCYGVKAFTAGPNVYLAGHLKIGGPPSSTQAVVQIRTASSSMLSLRVDTNRRLVLYNDEPSSVLAGSSDVLATNTWYRFGLIVDTDAGSADAYMGPAYEAFDAPFTGITGAVWSDVSVLQAGAIFGSQTIDLTLDAIQADSAAMPDPLAAPSFGGTLLFHYYRRMLEG